MFCPKCGSQIADNAEFCPHCGAPVSSYRTAQQPPMGYSGPAPAASDEKIMPTGPQQQGPQGQANPNVVYVVQKQPSQDDSGSFGWAVLGFFIPLVGLILWLVWKDEKPKCAQKAGRGALACVIVVIALYALIAVITILAVGAASSASSYSTSTYTRSVYDALYTLH